LNIKDLSYAIRKHHTAQFNHQRAQPSISSDNLDDDSIGVLVNLAESSSTQNKIAVQQILGNSDHISMKEDVY